MIVEVPVIGALAFHVLFYVKEGSFSLFELPVKQLQFSPCPFHSIPASIHLDLAGFGKSVNRALQNRNGFVSGITLHLRLFTRIPAASKRLTISWPISFASSTVGKKA